MMFVILTFIAIFIIKRSTIQCDEILCRNCGTDISHSSAIIDKKSPSSLNNFNVDLFGRENVLVQVLPKEFFLDIPVIVSNFSECIGVDEWEKEELWFSGYRWRPCFCPECGHFVGWSFEEYNPKSHNLDQFFVLILPSLVGEELLHSITVFPKLE